MLNFFKFLLGFLSLILLSILVNLSFFSSETNNQLDLNFLEWSNFSGAYINSINFSDNIYTSSSGSFKIKENNNDIEINLDKWVFILDLNDLAKNYRIKGFGFDIELKTIWDIYIDTSWEKILIFSLDSTSILKFLDINWNYINSFFIYPHEFIKFNPTIVSKSFKDVDIYRMKDLSKSKFYNNSKVPYFKYKLSDILKLKNKDRFVSLIWENNISFLGSYIQFKKDNLENNVFLYKKLDWLESVSFPLAEEINKYKYYFINDSKKVIYLQNNIYNKLILLFSKDTFDKNFIRNINSNLSELKTLSDSEYKKSINLINKFYKIILLQANIADNNKLKNFTFLRNDKINISNLENYIELKNIYFNYDYGIYDNMEKHFNLFLDSYVKNSWIIEENENFTLNDVEKISQIESFVFFLEEYINSYLFLNWVENFKYEANILKKYVSLNKMIYFSWKTDSIKIRTSLKKNKELLVKLERYLRSTFFNENREDLSEIFVLKPEILKNKSIKYNVLVQFEKVVENIYYLFNNNRDLLGQWDKELINTYDNLSYLFEEEFLALKDYEIYKSTYDKRLNELIQLRWLWEKNIEEYSVWDINSYLKQFYWIIFDKNNIFKKDLYFVIKNVIIYDSSYDFYLYPNKWNKLDLYEAWTDNFLYSYDMDDIQLLWDEKFKWSPDEEKNKYNFFNFFNEKLKEKKTDSIKVWNQAEICALSNQIPDNKWWCKYPDYDDASITVFKRDTLIGEEFSVINDYFTIEYNNLSVKYNLNKYDISIKDAKVEISRKGYAGTYLLKFSSNYDLEKHLFYNISFKIIDDKSYLFDWTPIKLKLKKIKIKDLKNTLENYSEDIKNIISIYSDLKSKVNVNNFVIEELSSKFYLKFDNNWKNIIIKFENWNIFSIVKDNISILDKTIKVNELNTMIYKLN